MKKKTGTIVFITLAVLLLYSLGKSYPNSDETANSEVVQNKVSDLSKSHKDENSSSHEEKGLKAGIDSDIDPRNHEQITEKSKQTMADHPGQDRIIQASDKEPEMFEIITDQQLTQYLSKFSMDTLKIKNYKKDLKQLSAKDNEYIQKFVGKFQGKMATHGSYFTIEPAVFDAEVEISGEKVEGQFVGDIEVKVIDKAGKVISHSQYHGTISSFFTDEKIDNPNLFSEDGDGNPSFYQFFLSRSLNQMVGNYYAPPLEGTNEYRRIGTLRLDKIL
ncbi:hypothetical protein [Oligoflexus tunisiensis]|uniref:hypothetical protein n=1 Tax=Oligoflexus tunisiensis TaxID=708132 RepID=UPI00114CCB06|nr:hypothetical protein [Oligoflexus tunisiensis]